MFDKLVENLGTIQAAVNKFEGIIDDSDEIDSDDESGQVGNKDTEDNKDSKDSKDSKDQHKGELKGEDKTIPRTPKRPKLSP